MLYVTTREKFDAFTPIRTLQSDCGSDGGRYLPYKMPHFSQQELETLKDRSFGQVVAEILSRFFDCRITAWDVEFAIGRHPVKIQSVGQKVLIAELWRNLEGSYEKLEQQLCDRVCSQFAGETQKTSWLRIAIGVAVLTGVFAELLRQGMVDALDISVEEGDFTQVMTVWYARQMGLPIANIICGCRDGSAAWDLIYNGTVRDTASMPELERLVRSALGIEEALRYFAASECGEGFSLLPNAHEQLRKGLFASVISRERVDAAIPNVKSTAGYQMTAQVAVAYRALPDYRARTGARRVALLLGRHNPEKLKER